MQESYMGSINLYNPLNLQFPFHVPYSFQGILAKPHLSEFLTVAQAPIPPKLMFLHAVAGGS